MATDLIELDNGILVEIDMPGEQIEQISGGMAKRVEANIDKIKPILISACRPISELWHELGDNINIAEAEVELGLSFEGEGNVYVTKLTAGANLKVTLVLKPRQNSAP